MWEAVEFWEGNFANEFNSSTKYRGPPTLERERAWNDLWHYTPKSKAATLPIRNSVPRSRSSTNCIVWYVLFPCSPPRHTVICAARTATALSAQTTEWNHGRLLGDQNVLRQYSWPMDKFDQSWGDLYPAMLQDPETGRTHVDHCIEALRLSLMCAGDITPVLFLHDEASPLGVRADFNVHHKCRTFDKLVDYVKKNGVELAT
ncbi:hypothetical protein MAC_02471 [Metarhizium acridum CQMa 102]|uniref:Uncharacterized protein n=1 Tax=Metarhizium acridum (strain CQMa 102) TaxID=655827 RepID=E9DXX3_METAQ|nr:uncharacterized protein MAC_02471 [Metarhizium acridum CQMa 102]EFY91586.1 hypothetical protein MAC_02471 [Metarhizium acridum CQMa 102]